MPLKLSEQPQCKQLSVPEVSFRTAMPVTHIRKYSSGDCYSVCPRCDMSLEREYMAYCDRCGQCVSWKNFTKRGKVFVIRK